MTRDPMRELRKRQARAEGREDAERRQEEQLQRKLEAHEREHQARMHRLLEAAGVSTQHTFTPTSYLPVPTRWVRATLREVLREGDLARGWRPRAATPDELQGVLSGVPMRCSLERVRCPREPEGYGRLRTLWWRTRWWWSYRKATRGRHQRAGDQALPAAGWSGWAAIRSSKPKGT